MPRRQLKRALAHRQQYLRSFYLYRATVSLQRSQRVLPQHALMGETWRSWRHRCPFLPDSEETLTPSTSGLRMSIASCCRRRLLWCSRLITWRGTCRRHLLNYLRQQPRNFGHDRRCRRRGSYGCTLVGHQIFVAGTAFFGPDCLPCLCECLL
jgi:hypothetical protein